MLRFALDWVSITNMTNEKRVGFYHKDCIDGTAAAAVLTRKFPGLTLFPIGNDYTEDTLEATRSLLETAHELIITDGTWGVEWVLDNFPHIKITVIDHHLSSASKLENLAKANDRLRFIYDLNHCASVLSWKYFFPAEAVPDLLRYVEDSDLWLERYAETKLITCVVSIYRNHPTQVANLFSEPITTLVERGRSLSEYIDSNVAKYLQVPPIKIRLGTYDVLAFNITDQQSVCGNHLAKEHHQAVALFTIKGEVVRFSFRSTDADTPAALDLAVTIGGGGHRNSSGGQLPLKDFIKQIIF